MNEFIPRQAEWISEDKKEQMERLTELWFKKSKIKPFHFVDKLNPKRPNKDAGWYYYGTYPFHIVCDICRMYDLISIDTLDALGDKKFKSTQVECSIDTKI